MARLSDLFLFFVFSFCASRVAASKCYLPNGATETDTAFMPCRTNTADPLSNICCGLNRTLAPGSDDQDGTVTPRDECLDNGICRYRFADNGVDGTLFFRASCTDKDYMNGECLKICTGGDAGGSDSQFTQVTPCDTDSPSNSTRWCCGGDRDCCNIDNLQASTIAAKFGEAVVTGTASSSSSTPSATGATITGSATVLSTTVLATSSTSTPSPSSTPTSTSSGGLSTGAKAGIGIGAALGAIALVAFGIWYGKRQNKGRADAYNNFSHEMNDRKPQMPVYYAHEGKTFTHEAAERPMSPRELMGNEPSELPGSTK